MTRLGRRRYYERNLSLASAQFHVKTPIHRQLVTFRAMTELRKVDLNLLVAFELLMLERNVSRAADKMSITQSAMSHVLQRLREQLDDPVLVKTTQGMQPTERALSLIGPVEKVLREVERLILHPASFDPATSQRRFVLAATDYLEF